MSDTSNDDTTATPPAEPTAAESTPPPVAAPAKSGGFLSRKPVQFAATGLAGLLIGGVLGGGVVAVFDHHGDRHERGYHGKFDQRQRGDVMRQRGGDQRQRGPVRKLPPTFPEGQKLPIPQAS